MARGDETRSVRRDAPLNENQRPVQLAESRRFFSASGNGQAVRQARALTSALGVGLDAYTGVLERRNERGTNQAVNEAAAGGDRDADNTNKGYNETFDQVEASNDLAIFRKELPELLQENNWSDMDEEGAQALIDNYYAGQLEGINPDSIYGQVIGEGILKQNALLLETHRGVQAEKDQQERRIMVYGELRSDYEVNGTIDHEKLMDRLHTLVPGPGGRMTYLESVFDIAEEMGDASIVDSIPESFPSGDPTGVNDPNMKDLFDTAKAKAHSVKTTRDKAAVDAFELKHQTQLAQLHSRDTGMADAGDMRVLENIREGGTEGPNGEPRRYTEAQQKTLYDKLRNAQETASDDAIILNDWMNGDGIGYTQAEVDSAHLGFVALVKENIPQQISDGGEDAINDYITALSLERGVVNGKLPSVYSDQLKVNLTNPEKFKQAGEMYQMLEAQSAGFAETQIGNAQSRSLYAYNRYLADTGGNEDDAIELMKQHDAGRSGNFNAEITATSKLTVDEIVDNKPGWGDHASTSRLKRLVNDEIRFYVDMGFEPDIAGQYAKEHIERRSRRAGDHIYAADAGWGNEPQAVYDWVIQNEAVHRGVDEDTLSIIPTGDPRTVRIQSSDEVLPSTKTYPISVFAEDYERFNSEAEQQRVATYESATDERLEEAEQRAFYTRYPPNPWGEPGQRATINKMNRESWNSMPAEQKKRLVQNELVEPQAAVKPNVRKYTDADFDSNGEFIRDPSFMATRSTIETLVP